MKTAIFMRCSLACAGAFLAPVFGGFAQEDPDDLYDLRVESIQIRAGEITANVWEPESGVLIRIGTEPNYFGWRVLGFAGDLGKGEELRVRIGLGEGKTILAPIEPRPEVVVEKGERSGPPPEVMDKLRALDDEQRRSLGEVMSNFRKQNPSVSREEMRQKFYLEVERIWATPTSKSKGGENPDN